MAKRVWKNPRLIQRAKKPDRTDIDGRVYDSLAERYRVTELRALLQSKNILTYAKQPVFRLGDDQLYTADFLVTNQYGTWAEDIKGGPPEKSFNRIKRLWNKYGPMTLFAMERTGRRLTVRETIPGKPAT